MTFKTALLRASPDLSTEVMTAPVATAHFAIPASGEIIEPFFHTVTVQMIAYYAALEKGTDVDQPKTLAKSVTVD